MVGFTKTQAAAILGVSVDAEETEIRTAFKRLALIWHPDKNTSPEATEKFKEINAAHKRMQQPDSEDEIEWDDDDDIVPFEQFMDLLAQLFARQAAARRNPFGGGFGGGMFGGGASARAGGPSGRSSSGGGHSHAHVHFGGMGRGPGFVFVPTMSRSDSDSEYETDSGEEDEDWRYRRGEQRKAEEQRRQEAAQKRQQEAQRRQAEAAERKKREDEANQKRREEQEARRKAEAKAKHDAAEALKRQKREEKARQKERQVAGAKEREEREEREAREKEEALAKEKEEQERRRREEQSRRDKAKAKEQAEAAAQAHADAMAAEAAAWREKKKVQQPKPMRKRGSGKAGDDDDAEDSPASSNPFAALKPESEVPKVKKAVKTKDLLPEARDDEPEPESKVPRVSAKATAAPRAAATPVGPAVNGVAKVVTPPSEVRPRAAPKVEKPPERQKSPEEVAREKEGEREKEARKKKSREEAARKRAEKVAYERMMAELEEKKRIEDEDRAMALRLQAEEERLARIEAYQRQQRAKQQQEEAKRAASRQSKARQAPGPAFVRSNGTAYASAAAAAAATGPMPPSPSTQYQSGLGASGPSFSTPSQPLTAPSSETQPIRFTQPAYGAPPVAGPGAGFVEQPTGFVEQPAGYDGAENGAPASEPLDPAVEAVWKMEQDRVEAGRRLDEDQRRKAEEQKQKKEEAERIEADRRKQVEDALLQKPKLAGAGGKRPPRRRRRGGGGVAGLEEGQGWPGAEFANGSSEWGGGSAGDGAPGEWEDVPGEGTVDEADFEEREREAEMLREEERQREERKQAQQTQHAEEPGSEFDISSILAEIASRAEQEHRASPTSPLEAVSATSDGSPDVHVPTQKIHRPPPRYAPYQPLKQTGGLQQPNGVPPMRTEADILRETWGHSNESGGTPVTSLSVQGGQESAPIDPMQVIRQLSLGRTSPPQEETPAPVPSYTTLPHFTHEHVAKGQTPQYGQHDTYSLPQQYPRQSAGSYHSSPPPPQFLQPQLSAYGGYPSSYASESRVQANPPSAGPPPQLYPPQQVYPSSQYPHQQQPFSQPLPAGYPGYYSSSTAQQGYKQPPVVYPASQSGYPGSAAAPPFSSGFGGTSQTYPQGGVGQFTPQEAAPQQLYRGHQEMGAHQYGWQGQYSGTGQVAGLHSSGQYTPSSDTPSPPDTSVTQPIRQGDSEYWVNERADANGAENEDEYPPQAAAYDTAEQTLGSGLEARADAYYQGGEGGETGAPTGAFGKTGQDGGYGKGYQEGEGWQSAPQESQQEWTAIPTGWGGGEEQQQAGDTNNGAGGYADGHGFADQGGYQDPAANGGYGEHEGRAQGGSASEYSSWGDGEAQRNQATGWGVEGDGQQNGQHDGGTYNPQQHFEGPRQGKGGQGFEGFGRTRQRGSDAYSNASNGSGSPVSGGMSQRPCRFFQRGNCKFGNRCKDAHVASSGPSRTSGPQDRTPAFHATSARDPPLQSTGWNPDPGPEMDQNAGFGGVQKRGPQGAMGRKGGPQCSGDVRKPGIYESEGENPGNIHSGGLSNNSSGRRGHAGSNWQPRGPPPRRSPM